MTALTKITERKLDAAPTGLHLTENKIYLSIKKKYIVETEYEALKLKKIATDQNIRTVVGSEDTLFCFSEKGSLYSVCLENSEVRKETRFGARVVSAAVYDAATDSIIIGTEKNKILICNNAFESHKTLYGLPTRIIGLDMSALNLLACIYEIDPVIMVFELKSFKSRSMRIPKGFPQAIVFIDAIHVVVGSQNGDLYLMNTSEESIVSSLSLSDPVTALYWEDGFLLVGTEGGSVCLASVSNNKIEIITTHQCNGMVNVLRSNKGNVVAAIGKEPRLGRWTTKKSGEHKLIIFGIE